MSRPTRLKAPVLDFEVLASSGSGLTNSAWRKPMKMGNLTFRILRDASAQFAAGEALSWF